MVWFIDRDIETYFKVNSNLDEFIKNEILPSDGRGSIWIHWKDSYTPFLCDYAFERLCGGIPDNLLAAPVISASCESRPKAPYHWDIYVKG